MRVLVFEYITGGGFSESALPASLAREGELMLAALIDDLAQTEGIELRIMRDQRLKFPNHPSSCEVANVSSQAHLAAVWRDNLQCSDAVWPIAPETNGIMEQYCREVAQAGKTLLNSPADAVHLAASKLDTLQRLRAAGLPAVPSIALDQWRGDFSAGSRYVIKPDDGVGCEGARIVDHPHRVQMPIDTGRWVVQPLLSGEPLSLCVLFNRGRARLLSVNRQLIASDAERFTLLGCQVNAVQDCDGSWQALAERIAMAVPKLWGYAGVDLMLTAAGPQILEINPRLTTSYAGLHEATGENPAAQVVSLWRTGTLPAKRGEPGRMVDILLGAALEH